MQRMETMKQSALWSGPGKLSPHGYYVFSLVDKPAIKLSPHGYYVFSLVDKPCIHEIWSSKLNLTMKMTINQSPKLLGS